MSYKEHENKYKENAFEHYSNFQLAMWIHNLLIRSNDRTSPEKCKKDINDAKNYLEMLIERLGTEKINNGKFNLNFIETQQLDFEILDR